MKGLLVALPFALCLSRLLFTLASHVVGRARGARLAKTAHLKTDPGRSSQTQGFQARPN